MIRFAIPALAIAATASQVQAAEVQIASQGPVVELSVSETVDAKPDIVDISAGVTSQARTAVEAMQINAREMTAVIDRIKALTTYAQDTFGCSMTQLALAWCVKNPNVTTVLLGATKTEQLEENLGAISVVERMTDAHMADIEGMLGNTPAAYSGFGGSGMRAIETI